MAIWLIMPTHKSVPCSSRHIGKAAKTISQQQIINQRIYILRRLHRSNAFVRIMHYFHSRTIFNFVIGCSQTPTEIHVLRIHKNIFIKPLKFFKNFSAYCKCCSGHPTCNASNRIINFGMLIWQLSEFPGSDFFR